MDYNRISSLILDESENMVYISDMESYELVYMNRALMEKFDIDRKRIGDKCYKVLQGLEAPCPFCTNECLKKDGYHVWKHYNPILKQHYELKDKLIEIDGRNMRLEISVDITESEAEHMELERQLSVEETLVECIHTLSEHTEIDTAIEKLLQIIGDFYQAERVYIFEIDYDARSVSNSYEWRRDGVTPQIDNLQDLPICTVDIWLETFKARGVFYFDSLRDFAEEGSEDYELLASQGIEKLMAAPFWKDGVLIGFIGVDNPSCGTGQIKLLQSVPYFIENDITKRHMLDNFRKLSYSDNMMYVEKQVYYGNGVEGKNSYHEVLAKKLVEEIASGEFEVYLQPKVNIDTGELYGAEALVRRRTEDGEVLMPGQFIPLYEAEGVIQQLDLYVFEEVCRLLDNWKEKGYRMIPIAVNFSRISLMGIDIIESLARIRGRYGVAPGLLTIEVTESISRMGAETLGQLMERFKEHGFALSLDDYGTRYSNLSLLARLDFKELKIDQSLIKDIMTNWRSRIVLEHTIQMCQELGIITAVAEGIETEEQRELLRSYHCDIGQGYLFSEPIPIGEFLDKYGRDYLY